MENENIPKNTSMQISHLDVKKVHKTNIELFFNTRLCFTFLILILIEHNYGPWFSSTEDRC